MFARCLYGYCTTMWQEEGNICLQEEDVVKRKNLQAVEVKNMEERPKCIVEHPGFQALCLNYLGVNYKLFGNTSSSMVRRHMWDQVIKKQALCLQTIDKVVLGLPWQGHKSYIMQPV